MKKKVEMVMLPALGTDWTVFKNVHLGDRVFTLDMELGGAMNALNYKGQHLYATVSQDVEPIKEGDWIYDTLGGKVVQWYDGDNHDKYDRKIIATTDPKLAKSISRLLGVTQSLPQLPLSFIKKYVSNPDGEFEVEYEEYGLSLAGLPEYHSSLPDYILKLNQDNEVDITSVEKLPILVQQDMSCTLGVGEGGGQMYVHGNYKSIKHLQGKLLNMEKMYSEEQLIDLLLKTEYTPLYEREYMPDWIKENL